MKTFTYKELPQLQTLVFARDCDDELEPDGRGYYGPMVVVKLNDYYLVALSDLVAEMKEDSTVCGQVVSPDEAKAEVIPIKVGIPERKLHEIIVRVGLGRNLINLGRRR